MKTYNELLTFKTYEERFNYLKMDQIIGDETFGHLRYLNQRFYRSPEWRRFRRDMILRDNGCDMALPGYEIFEGIHLHHINPITPDDIVNRNPFIFDPNNVVCVSEYTHKRLTYWDGEEIRDPNHLIIRKPGDTTLW